jgi:hypothetical protein
MTQEQILQFIEEEMQAYKALYNAIHEGSEGDFTPEELAKVNFYNGHIKGLERVKDFILYTPQP